MRSPRDLFIYQLSAIHSAEQIKLQMLLQMEQACQNPRIKQLFGDEIPETQQQIVRVQECFRLLGVQPMNVTSRAIDCVRQDAQQFMQQGASQTIADLFSLETSLKVDHYEIAAYTELVGMARALGETQVMSLLEENLHEEQHTSHEVEKLSRQLGAQVIQRMRP